MKPIIHWIQQHPESAMILITALLNLLFKSRTSEELSRLPRWMAIGLTTLRSLFPDPAPLLSLIAGALLRQDVKPLPGIESLPPPPKVPQVEVVIKDKSDE